MTGCFICRKHRELDDVAGGVIAADDHAVVTHLPPVTPNRDAREVYLGYLFVELRRHAPGLEDLDAREAASVGRLSALAARALRYSEGAEHVYAAVIGHEIDHFHLHLIPRYPGTPRDFWWVRVDEWPGAPRGDAAAIDALAQRLRGYLAAERPAPNERA